MRIHTHFSFKVKKKNNECLRKCKNGHTWVGYASELCPYCPRKGKNKRLLVGPHQPPVFKEEWPSLDIQYGWFDGDLIPKKKKRFNVKTLKYKIAGSHLL